MPDEIVSTNAARQRVTNLIHIVVDDVTFGTGGRWGKWAHGGGSSLELKDPNSNNRLAANWAESDETQKSANLWTDITYTGVLDNGSGDATDGTPTYLHVFLEGAGECLISHVGVVDANGVNQVVNPDFAGGTAGWTFTGSFDLSSIG